MAHDVTQVQILKILNAGEFWAKEAQTRCMSAEAVEFQNLSSELNAYAENDEMPAMRITHPSPGMVCLGRRMSGQNGWYRVRIKCVLNTSHGPQASCFLLDYAQDGEMIPVQFLRKLPEEFLRVPFQAKKCSLHGIQPVSMTMETGVSDVTMEMKPSKKWDSSSKNFIHGILKDAHGSMIETISKDAEGCYHVRLHITLATQQKICVNDLLVKEQYATYTDITVKAASSGNATSSESDQDRCMKTKKKHSMKGVKEFLNPDVSIPNFPGYSGNDPAGIHSSNHINDSTTDRMSQPTPLIVKQDSITPVTPISLGRSQLLQNAQETLSNAVGKASNTSPGREARTPDVLTAVSVVQGSTLSPSTSSSISVHSPHGSGLSPASLSPVSVTSPPLIGRGRILQQVLQPETGPVGRGLLGAAGRGSSISQTHLTSTVTRDSLPCVGRGRQSSAILGSSNQGVGPALLEKKCITPETSQFNDYRDSDTSHTSCSDMDRHAILSRQSRHESSPDPSTQVISPVLDDSAETIPSDLHSPLPMLRSSPILRNEASSPGFPTAKNTKKNVSFSDHEEFFSVPSERVPPKDNFRASTVVTNESLQMFAKASSSFTATADQMKQVDPSPEDYNVQVYGIRKPKFFYKIKDIPFSESVRRTLEFNNIKDCSRLQMYSWPVLLRGRTMVGIGSPSTPKLKVGKTLGYLAPLLTLLKQNSSYEQLPVSCGPLALIVSSNTRKALEVNKFLMEFSKQDHGWKSMVIFAGRMEQEAEVQLLNGCEILISSPPCLLRMLKKKVTNLARLSHLILDDLDQLLEDSPEKILDLMKMFEKEMAERGSEIIAPRQVIAMSSQWTKDVEIFCRSHMNDPVVVMASPLEASFAAHVKQIALVCLHDQRTGQLLDQITCSLGPAGHKVLVFVQSSTAAQTLYSILQSSSIVCLRAHDDMPHTELDNVIRHWNLSHKQDSRPVMVCTDSILESYLYKIVDATCVIHYDVPNKKSLLEKRLWCMFKHWRSPFDDAQAGGDRQQCLSYWYQTETNDTVAANIIKLLERSGSEVPQQICVMAEKHEENKECGKRNQLCDKLKAFGCCPSQKRCLDRHRVFHSLDYPGQNPKYFAVPMEGQVKLMITHVNHASRYFARMLEVTDLQNNTTILSGQYAKLLMQMATWYMNPTRKIICEYPQASHLYAYEDTQHTFNRVEVLYLYESGRRAVAEEARVFFVDTGREANLHTAELLTLPEDLANIIYQAVEVYICRVKPKDGDDEWTKSVDSMMASKIQNRELVGNIALSLGCTIWLDPLVCRTRLEQLGIISNEFSVRNLLIEDKMAEENIEHLQMLYDLCRDRVDIPHTGNLDKCPTMAYTVHSLISHTTTREMPDTKDYIKVLLRAIDNPDLIYVQLHEDQDRIQNLQWDISDFVKHTDSQCPDTLKLATLVLAKFPVDDMWYRGKVTDVSNDEYDIFFVDYGDSEVVKKADIRPMPTRFQNTPFFAIECCLVGLESISGEWSEESGNFVYNLSRWEGKEEECKILMAKVVSCSTARHTGRFLYGVEFYDTRKEYDVNLGYELILNDMAKLSSTKIKELFPQLSSLPADNPAAEICQSCIQLLETQDPDVHVKVATDVQRIVLSNIRNREKLAEQNVICAMCAILQLNRNPIVLELFINSLAYLVKESEPLCEELWRQGGINSMVHILDTTTEAVTIKNILWVFQQLIKVKSCVLILKNFGVLRILADIWSRGSCDSEMLLIEVLSDLLKEINSCELNKVDSSGCLEVISQKIQSSDDKPIVCRSLQILGNLASSHINSRDRIRKKGGVKAICLRMETLTDPQMKEEAVKTLKSLANNNRYNKDVMNEYQTKSYLQKYSEDSGLSMETRQYAAELLQRLQSLVSREKATKYPVKQPQTAEHVNGYDKSNGVHFDDLNISAKNKIKNKPLPPKFCSTTEAIKSEKPNIRWVQDKWNILLTVEVKNVAPREVVKYTEDRVIFRVISESIEYSFEFHLYEMIVPSRCQIDFTLGSVHLGLRKKTHGCWPRLLKQKQKLPYLSLDFERYVDSSSEDGSDELDTEEPKDSPLILVKRSIREYVSFSNADKSKRRMFDGIPPELMMEACDGDGDSEDSFDEYICPENPNKKYDYFVP